MSSTTTPAAVGERTAAEFYDNDPYSWSVEQGDALRRRDIAAVDWGIFSYRGKRPQSSCSCGYSRGIAVVQPLSGAPLEYVCRVPLVWKTRRPRWIMALTTAFLGCSSSF